jgi:hypothetical protein
MRLPFASPLPLFPIHARASANKHSCFSSTHRSPRVAAAPGSLALPQLPGAAAGG